jgi:hypothetical protein
VGGVLDLVYASGDQNLYDRRASGFKAIYVGNPSHPGRA